MKLVFKSLSLAFLLGGIIYGANYSKASSPAEPSKPSVLKFTPVSPLISCAGVLPWNSATAYSGGYEVVYGGHRWVALWWTQGDVPGGPAKVWEDKGPCTSSF